MTIQELNAKLDHLASLRAEHAMHKQVTDLIQEDIDILKLEIMGALQANKLKNFKTETLQVTRSEKPSVQITDPNELIKWINDQGEDPANYFRLDVTNAKAYVAGTYKNTGEIPPGTEVEMKDVLTLREVR